MYAGLKDYLWIPLVLIFLFPVFKSTGSHAVLHDEGIMQGPLFYGRDVLDSLLIENRGKPIIVNFWATWCTPCVAELPHIDEVYMSMDGDIAAFAVDLGDPELETLLSFREGFILSMPVIWLSENDASRLREEWGLANVLPVTVIFDPAGDEIIRAAGVRDESFFRNAVTGYSFPDTAEVQTETDDLHINVVGFGDDSLTVLLLDKAVELAGTDGVDYYDPSFPTDSIRIQELYLPDSGYPYAQPCIGSACGPPSSTPDDLQQSVENMLN